MNSSSRKRRASPELVSNPFVKKRNLEWSISPPPFRNADRRGEGRTSTEEGSKTFHRHEVSHHPHQESSVAADNSTQKPLGGPSASALVENNTVKITDHLAWFSNLLAKAIVEPFPAGQPHLTIPAYQSLYNRSFRSPAGAHFVVTQHDHPVAGPHYDLRLQINGDSSCSWAIMYGLPGDPNSRGRTGRAAGAGVLRNATETRVHCLWNHLVETAGLHTGSLLVWDTGSYEVLPPRRSKYAPVDSQEGDSDGSERESWDKLSQQDKLAAAFSSRKIRLRLNGSRLPRGYAVNLRLTKDEDAAGRAKAARPAGARKRRGRKAPPKKAPETSSDGEDDSGSDRRPGRGDGEEDYNDGSGATSKKDVQGILEMEKELRELEDAEVRRTNAYSGAVNSIGSVHQRKWFLSLDREECGFFRTKKDGRVWWERQKVAAEDTQGSDHGQGRLQWPFYVRGPGHERSIVTGRLGAEVLRDEGVVGYVGRKGWRPILR
ncbi:hypothetical protein INS49_002189 [Diaporthe citri]|uniref:uncharacterized protein n=1 Tax=Diaporthe citri TaxID=83186 RepID=UPI001C807CD2|nr:uncharacterized protein INS49_002189 [Diaporthe citri]KAG6367989.1 hypothetical protein INS49_002189 [Diaporthe citri]